jgi:hypothetical protein
MWQVINRWRRRSYILCYKTQMALIVRKEFLLRFQRAFFIQIQHIQFFLLFLSTISPSSVCCCLVTETNIKDLLTWQTPEQSTLTGYKTEWVLWCDEEYRSDTHDWMHRVKEGQTKYRLYRNVWWTWITKEKAGRPRWLWWGYNWTKLLSNKLYAFLCSGLHIWLSVRVL